MFGKKRKSSENSVDSVISLEPTQKQKGKRDKEGKKNKKKKKAENVGKETPIFNFNHKPKDESSVVSVYVDVLRAIQEEDIITPILDLPEFMLNSMNINNINVTVSKSDMSTVDATVNFQKEIDELSHNDEIIQDMLKEIEEPLKSLAPLDSTEELVMPLTESVESTENSEELGSIENVTEPIISIDDTETDLTDLDEEFEDIPSLEDITSTEDVNIDEKEQEGDIVAISEIYNEAEKEEVVPDKEDIDSLMNDIDNISIEPMETVCTSKEEDTVTQVTGENETLTDEEAHTLKSLLNLSNEDEDKKSEDSLEDTQSISLEKEPLTVKAPVGMMLDMDDVQTSSIKEEL